MSRYLLIYVTSWASITKPLLALPDRIAPNIKLVEQAVRIVYAHVYAPLRHHEFTSLKALNE